MPDKSPQKIDHEIVVPKRECSVFQPRRQILRNEFTKISKPPSRWDPRVNWKATIPLDWPMTSSALIIRTLTFLSITPRSSAHLKFWEFPAGVWPSHNDFSPIAARVSGIGLYFLWILVYWLSSIFLFHKWIVSVFWKHRPRLPGSYRSTSIGYLSCHYHLQSIGLEKQYYWIWLSISSHFSKVVSPSTNVISFDGELSSLTCGLARFLGWSDQSIG
jgi:hypothetical protein